MKKKINYVNTNVDKPINQELIADADKKSCNHVMEPKGKYEQVCKFCKATQLTAEKNTTEGVITYTFVPEHIDWARKIRKEIGENIEEIIDENVRDDEVIVNLSKYADHLITGQEIN